MIPAYITFVVDNTRNYANNTNIADDIEMSSINSNDDDEYLNYYDKDLNQQNMTTNNVMQDVITNLDDENDDDTMETIAILQTPERKESCSRMMMMLTDSFGFVDSSKKEDYGCMNMNLNTNNYSNSNYNYSSNYNYNDNDNVNTNTNTNIINYECGSLFEDYDDVMFPSETIITVD